MALRGWASLAWQSDYGQFYLVDPGDSAFRPPEEITPEMMNRSLFVPANGLVVYTEGCLQQRIDIAIHDTEPDHPTAEPMGGNPWARVGTVGLLFPSRRFALSSPSSPSPLPCGPFFLLDSATVMARISWMEFQGSRDDSVPVEPDVIAIALWPA
ncbi:hypothetical protein [Roseomonas indoligenes]|uniref:Uncharacterized protein n=1 Tax=Roseomonas indoligenes TaxID=2820811 RepID=A0A940S629_9PROT|nr:hypothetical protein [Pararoseomonas indoligenes]MBP0493619.1 hypothetical protein [Pararoseomonas indoligenes]